jgi:hypothetical protein
MSYRPDDQSIEGPAREIIEGIERFEAALKERAISNEWKNGHIAELVHVAKELAPIKFSLMQLAEETW